MLHSAYNSVNLLPIFKEHQCGKRIDVEAGGKVWILLSVYLHLP